MKWPILPIVLLFCMMIFQGHLIAKEKPRPGHTYTLILPDDVPLNNLTIEYFLIGESDGGMGVVEHTGGGHQFVIPTDEAGKEAAGLDVVIFCPGYQTVTIYEPSLVTSKRKSLVTMEKLPMLHLAGQIADYTPLPVRKPIVNITYVGFVGLPHWILWDGRFQSFKIATVPLQANGSFSVEIPDFLHDKNARGGYMKIAVQVKDPGETLLCLSRDPKDPKGLYGYFKPQQTYEPIVTFYGNKGLHPELDARGDARDR